MTCEEERVSREGAARLVIGGERYDVTAFVHKRGPLVEPVSERSAVQVGAAQVITLLGVGVFGAVGAIPQAQNPSGIWAVRIGVEDTREWEAQLRESTRSADRLKDSGLDGSARAVRGFGYPLGLPGHS